MELESVSESGVRVGQCDKALGFDPPSYRNFMA